MATRIEKTDLARDALYDKVNTMIDEVNTKISNCITEIPQDIKLELNNGTLTLKAGSKVYVPNGKDADGSNKFDVVVISADITKTWTVSSSNKVGMFFVNGNNPKEIVSYFASSCVSGATAPTLSSTYGYWYDTTNNLIKITSNKGSSWSGKYSFPICIVTANTTQITSIDQVFNGFGYIGNTIFALPGVKGLIPNGRNADGSLKSIEYTVNQVLTKTHTSGTYARKLVLMYNSIAGYTALKYDELSNYNIDNGVQKVLCDAGTYITDNGRITSFTPKTVFHAVDYNDFSDLKNNFSVQPNVSVNGNARYKSVCQGYTKGTAPTVRQFGGVSTTDKNGVEIATLYSSIDTKNTVSSALWVKQPTATGTAAQEISIYCDKNGNFYTHAPQCKAANSIVTTVSHSTNYVRLGNGLQICWGNSAVNQTITFQQPFKDTGYSVTFCQTDGGERNINNVVSNKATTSFRFSRGYTGDWIAIGYWY